MKIDVLKLQIAMAIKQMRASDIHSVSPDTWRRASSGKPVKPVTVGLIAEELGVSVTDLVEVSK